MVKQFSDDYSINIRAVSIDGGSTPSFKDYKIDSGESKALNVTAVPTLFLYENSTKEIIPIGSGFIARDNLSERIYLLTQVKTGDDY